MKVYPLIYSRTKFVDYVSGFLVRPKDLDYKCATKYVSDALNEIKYSGGLRHAVFSVGEYIVYGGTACMTPVLINRILKEKRMNQLDFEFKEFQSDKADRPIVFFIGFAIKRTSIENANHIPDIDLYKTYKIYLKYLKKQWFNVTTKTEELNPNDGIDIEIIKGVPEFSPEIIEKNGISLIKNYDENLYQDIINYYFRQSVMYPNTDISFLSHVLPEMINDSLMFNNISIYGITVEEYLRQSDNKKTESRTIQSSESEETNKVIHSIDESNGGIASNTSTKKTKRPNNMESPFYNNTEQLQQDKGDDSRKKSPPISRKIILTIAIVLLMGMILLIAHQINNTKKKSIAKEQNEEQAQEVQVSNPTDNVEQEIIQSVVENSQQM